MTRAFTLVEVLLVVVCLAILSVLVLPKRNDDEATQLRLAAQLLIADIEFAQLESIGNSENPLLIEFDPIAATYWISRRQDHNQPILQLATNQPYLRSFGKSTALPIDRVHVAQLDLQGNNQIQFTSMGALNQTNNASITLQCGNEILHITIDAATGEPSAF